jgi:hypothetical protein
MLLSELCSLLTRLYLSSIASRYKVVIYTNQGGLEKGKEKAADLQGKILDIIKQVCC